MDVISQEVHTQATHNRSKGHDSQVLIAHNGARQQNNIIYIYIYLYINMGRMISECVHHRAH